jgi:hypothetical protein
MGEDVIRADRYDFSCFGTQYFFRKCLPQFAPLSDFQCFEIDKIGMVDNHCLDCFPCPVPFL